LVEDKKTQRGESCRPRNMYALLNW
jgi:hypothetical protein